MARGFTLVELTLVLVLAGILAIAAWPALDRLAALRTDGALTAVLAHLRYVQGLAMARHRSTWMVFDEGTDSYQAFIEDLAQPGKENRLPVVDPVTLRELSVRFSDLLAPIDLTAADLNGGNEIEFDSFGAPYDGGGVPLATGTLSFAGGGAIEIEPETGHALIVP